MAKGKTVWIGLFNNPWKWSHKGEYSSFQNWNTGEPNNEGSNSCVEVYGKEEEKRGKWNDAGCHNSSPYVCYNGTSERYILIEELKTWTEAQQYCREHHTDLVSVKNADENIQIKEKAKGAAVWIGLFNNPWKWSDGGDYHTFLNWSEKQPDNYGSKEKCVMIKNQSNTPELSDAHAAKSTHLFAMTVRSPVQSAFLFSILVLPPSASRDPVHLVLQ
ncbi:ASGR1 protein, partial [Polyodon spathula]|nr:ASGR1 protein [Polyodon spathula]